MVRLFRQREERDRCRTDWDFHFDEAAATEAVGFFKMLRHSKGEWSGKPFEPSPWQEFDLIRPLFGWKRKDGTRRFRTAYVEIPRKNGKSAIAAGIGNKLFLDDNEPGAEVYAAATKRDQAKIVFNEARAQVRGMMKEDPNLRQFIHVTEVLMDVPSRRSKFEPLGADANTMDGLNVHGAVVDEIHKHKTADVWNVLDTATGARRQPLLFGITTAGYDRESVCWKLHTHAINILEGNVEDDSFFAYITTIDEGDDWKDEACWGKANPNLGSTVKLDDLRRKLIKAKEEPQFENEFKRLHLNVWTEQATRYFPMDKWDACEPRRDVDDLLGQDCFGGLDLAQERDLTGFTLVFPDGDAYDVRAWAWIPEEKALEWEKRDRVPYRDWVKRGFVKLTSGDAIDFECVLRDILGILEKYNPIQIGYDPRFGGQISQQLAAQTGVEIVKIPQTFACLSEPMKKTKELILTGKLRHGGSPLLRWQAANTAVATDRYNEGLVRPYKGASNGRIDNIVALIMAMGRAILHTPQPVYYTQEWMQDTEPKIEGAVAD